VLESQAIDGEEFSPRPGCRCWYNFVSYIYMYMRITKITHNSRDIFIFKVRRIVAQWVKLFGIRQ
jgi:hypothetical protein